jgi:acetyl esterase/lipase
MTNGASAIRIDSDIIYGRGGDIDLKLDVYIPQPGTEKRTAVLQLHGGGFTRGAKENLAANCRLFASRGYVAVASQYRLAHEGQWPDQLHDVKAAVRWTRANAAGLGVDPDKIAIAGYSAGANLSLIASGSEVQSELEGSGGNEGVSSAVAACLAFYSPDQARRPGNPLISDGSPDALYLEASPITYARAGAPPTALFHSTGDTTVPFDASQRLFEAFKEAGVAVELHLFEGLSHVFDRHPEFAAPTIEICDLFLDRHVVSPRVYPPFAPGVARPRMTTTN